MRSILRRIRQSLSLKLSLGILLLTVPIFVIALGILFQQSRSNIRQETVKRATSLLTTTSKHVERYLSNVEDAANSYAWLIKEHFQPESLLHFSRLVVAFNGNVSGCSITAAPDAFPQYGCCFSAYSVREPIKVPFGDSLMVDSITTVREVEDEYFDKVWYKTPVEQGHACWIDPFDDFNEDSLLTPGMIASYAQPLYDGQGQLLGVLAANLSLPQLSSVISSEKPYPNGYFFLLGSKGNYYVHPDSSRLVKETIFSLSNASEHPDVISLGHEMTTGKQGSMNVIIDGRPCLVCYKPLPGTRWSLALVCPQSDIFRSHNLINHIIIILIVVGLLAILLFIRHVVGRAVKPLYSLIEQCQHFAEGQFDEHIPHSLRPDVVGRLQNSFATMQESLDRHLSDIQQVNAEAQQRNVEIQEARRLALESSQQKTLFMQDMTHQIRTPLNVIMGFSHVLRNDPGQLPEEDLKKITIMIDHNAMLLKRMVLMLYDSSDTGQNEELKSPRNEEVSCNDLARECLETHHSRFPGMPVAFETDLPDSFRILTNSIYLSRSILELLYNAAKYSDGQHILLRLAKTDSTVQFIFQDEGPGIDSQQLERMFVPFTKLNDLSEGLGLGLPLSKRHAQTLGGDLYLDADYHAGCRFIFELPL